MKIVTAIVLAPLCALCALHLGTEVASASIQTGDHLRFIDGVGGPGGVFHIDDLNDPGSPDFSTFCIEITEHVNFGSTYAVESIGLVTKNGGKTLSPYTAWLYNSFLDGSLNGFNPAIADHANTLQLAIWKGMGYLDAEIKHYIGTNWFDTYAPLLSGTTWSTDFASANWTDVGHIRVMNLRQVNGAGVLGANAQDQLVRIDAPEPASLLIWSWLAVSIGIVATRRKNV